MQAKVDYICVLKQIDDTTAMIISAEKNEFIIQASDATDLTPQIFISIQDKNGINLFLNFANPDRIFNYIENSNAANKDQILKDVKFCLL